MTIDTEQAQPPQQVPPEVTKLLDLLTAKLTRENETRAYANNTRFESSAWDLKLMFGQLDQRHSAPIVDWHTTITVSWAQAKVMSYYLLMNIAAYEQHNGKIQIPSNVVPIVPEAPTEEVLKANPGTGDIHELAIRLHRDMFES